MQITFVKKIKADGTPCRKCLEVEARMREAGVLQRIDTTVVADERDGESEGMRLAAQHKVEQAPFFLVTDANGQTQVYTAYFKFLKEVLNKPATEEEEAAEIMQQNDSLDFL